MALQLVEQMKARYAQLEVRDRRALVGLSTFFGALVLWFGFWQPVNQYLADNQASRDAAYSLIQYMRASEQAARRAAGDSQVASQGGQSLLSTVSGFAQRQGIKPNRLQPEGGDAVSVWFDQVPFDALVVFMQELESRGIRVRQISVDREDTPGTVRARLVLSG